MERLKSEEESFFFEQSRSQEGKMVEADIEAKIEKVVSKTAPKTQQSSTAGDGKVKMTRVGTL